MPVVSFKKNKPSIQVSDGANLMRSLLESGIPVASSCNGDGVCAKCKIKIVDGEQNLSSENELEVFLKQKFAIPQSDRISCQTKVNGDITIDASYW